MLSFLCVSSPNYHDYLELISERQTANMVYLDKAVSKGLLCRKYQIEGFDFGKMEMSPEIARHRPQSRRCLFGAWPKLLLPK